MFFCAGAFNSCDRLFKLQSALFHFAEDEAIPPLVLKEQPKGKWGDEDVDEDDVKESWEDEDEPAPV